VAEAAWPPSPVLDAVPVPAMARMWQMAAGETEGDGVGLTDTHTRMLATASSSATRFIVVTACPHGAASSGKGGDEGAAVGPSRAISRVVARASRLTAQAGGRTRQRLIAGRANRNSGRRPAWCCWAGAAQPFVPVALDCKESAGVNRWARPATGRDGVLEALRQSHRRTHACARALSVRMFAIPPTLHSVCRSRSRKSGDRAWAGVQTLRPNREGGAWPQCGGTDGLGKSVRVKSTTRRKPESAEPGCWHACSGPRCGRPICVGTVCREHGLTRAAQSSGVMTDAVAQGQALVR
jgi:hypothetical protein